MRVKINNEHIAKLSDEKTVLEKNIVEERLRKSETAAIIKSEISDLEKQIVQNLKETLNVYDKSEEVETSSTPPDSSKKLLNFLISKKEGDLECPICLVTATVPIYSCHESHLICNTCRPKVTECPECRVEYKDKEQYKRHRYAERMVEELDMLRRELLQ